MRFLFLTLAILMLFVWVGAFVLFHVAGALIHLFLLLALVFFIVVTPLGLAMRMLGKDPLRLRRPAGAESYWSEVRRKSSLDRLF